MPHTPQGLSLQGKATDPLIHAKGSATLLLQLGRKAHVHAPIQTSLQGYSPWGRKELDMTEAT